MRAAILLALVAGFLAPLTHGDIEATGYSRAPSAAQTTQCLRENLAVKEGETDAAMGGVRATDFIFTNISSRACTLNGYPRVELLNQKRVVGRRAVPSAQLPTDSEKMRPQLVTLEASKQAWFRIHYNSGGAGHMGKPCSTFGRIKIVAPGTTRAFVLRSNTQSCSGTEFEVSAVRAGTPQ